MAKKFSALRDKMSAGSRERAKALTYAMKEDMKHTPGPTVTKQAPLLTRQRKEALMWIKALIWGTLGFLSYWVLLFFIIGEL